MVVICPDTFDEIERYTEYFNYFDGFDLSSFQKWAIKSIVDNQHILVTAHTGSGKTLPAEFAIQYFVSKGKKVIYTAPIKALSNTKLYDLRNKYPEISFGIITCDITDNPEADVLIMTTEILPNTIMNRKLRTTNENIKLDFEIDFENDFRISTRRRLETISSTPPSSKVFLIMSPHIVRFGINFPSASDSIPNPSAAFTRIFFSIASVG